MRTNLIRVASIADLRRLAHRRLPRPMFDFLDGAAGDEVTHRDNVTAFQRYEYRPRVGMDVSRRTIGTTVLGAPMALPFGLSPVGFSGLLHPHGEILAARAAADAGIPYCLSTFSVASIEEVAAAAPEADKWFQLYFVKDRKLLNSLLDRARAANFRVLCVTVDLPVAGRRDRDVRNGFTVPPQFSWRGALEFASHPAWLLGVIRAPVTFGNFEANRTSQGVGSLAKHIGTLFDPAATWEDIARLRDIWKGPMILKGVLHPADAERAVGLGIDGLSASNHGGRQLDGSPSALDALVEIAGVARGKIELMIDGGIRRGGDMAKALALGATFCLIGRAYAYGLAAAGKAGVDKAIALLAAELDNTLTLLGEPDIGKLGPAQVRRIGLR